MFRYAESLKDATRLQGASTASSCLMSVVSFPPEVVSFLESRVRSGRADVPVIGVRSTANPGGPGHQAVKSEFIDGTAYGQHIVTDVRGRTVRFVPAGLKHNPHINPEYAADLQKLPEAMRRAFLDGDWDSFAGQMFPELDRERHVVRPMPLPSSWRRLAGVDWGFRAPWAVIWIAEDEDRRLWAYRECYETEVGESEQARRILAAEGDEQVTRYGDSAMWARRGDARSIADCYEAEGMPPAASAEGTGQQGHRLAADSFVFGRGPGVPASPVDGWQTCPMLHMFSTCENLWAELTSLPMPWSATSRTPTRKHRTTSATRSDT